MDIATAVVDVVSCCVDFEIEIEIDVSVFAVRSGITQTDRQTDSNQ